MAEKKPRRAVRNPHDATDKRRPGLGDNQKITVPGDQGNGPILADLFYDRRKKMGVGKRAF
ncbi:hypothetical protein GCM10010149_88740 [Nonomuraea roseoviolacea subsp. roseoviolacea]|uniref:hypothetical protein n=1 Tax=Nonomuraea roseoviolacea TaxID=103837 RepID=UPI0031E3F35A